MTQRTRIFANVTILVLHYFTVWVTIPCNKAIGELTMLRVTEEKLNELNRKANKACLDLSTAKFRQFAPSVIDALQRGHDDVQRELDALIAQSVRALA